MGTRTARRTSKIWSNDEKNREEQSQRQAKKKSRANGRQSEPKDCEPRQGEVRGETQYKGKLQPSSPRCPVGKIRAEAWRSYPSHQLQRGNRGIWERKLSRQLRSSDTESPENRGGLSRLEADVWGQSAQQLKTAAMLFDEQKTSTVTKEDLEQNSTDITVAMQRQVLVIQKAHRTVDAPLLQYIDTTFDVPVAKQRREDTTGTARGLYDEVQRNPDGQKMRSAYLMSENK